MDDIKYFNVNELSYEEYLQILKNARRLKFKVKIQGICKECNKSFEKSYTSKEGFYICSKCLGNKTKIKNYGSLENAEKIKRKKIEETCIKKYGCLCTFQSENVKEKIKETLTDKYGNGEFIQNPSQLKWVRDKIKKTNLEKYGTEEYLQSKDAREKTIKTSLKKYGTESPNSSEIVKNNKMKSCIEKYGVSNPNKLSEVQEKVSETCLKRYGRRWNVYKYYYDGLKFDSSYELKLYIYLKDMQYNFVFHPVDKIKEYFIDGKKHFYEPDFLINGKLYEIKGSHWFNENGELIDVYNDKTKVLIEKQNVMSDVIILTENDELLKNAFEYFEKLGLKKENFKKNDNNS